MAVKVKFQCGGCGAEAWGTGFLTNEFHSFNGKGYGFGVYHQRPIEEITPAGWIAFDPCTQCTYCPECWKELCSGVLDD